MNPVPMIRKEDWTGKNHTAKLDTIFEAVNKMYALHQQYTNRIKPLEYAVFDNEGGILPQLTKVTSHAQDVETRYSKLVSENLQLRDELEIIKGVVHKQGKQISVLQTKLADQVARSMANNITISGLVGDHPKQDAAECRALVESFLTEELELNEEMVENNLIVAHRIGSYVKNKHRTMVIKVRESLAGSIFGNTSKLRGKLNEQDRSFSVNPQLPDMLAEQRRETRKIIKDKKDSEVHLPDNQKSSFLVRNGKVFINGQLQRKLLTPPLVKQLFVGEEEQAKINAIKFCVEQAEPIKGSTFTAYATTVSSMNELHLAYIKMFQNNPSADHIIAAYSCERQTGFQDDSEFGSGYRVLQVLEQTGVGDIAVFITRDYGGEHLGPQRFQTMRDLADKVLQKLI